jgi:hypothetical protein
MSHYAKVVEPLAGEIHQSLRAREAFTLPIGTEIKSVKVVDGGYACIALVRLKYERAARWVSFSTFADLPAFTDKGREGRARHPRATMAKGRPAKGATAQSEARGLRMRKDQWDVLDYNCKNADVSRNEAIVGALVTAGLVPQ